MEIFRDHERVKMHTGSHAPGRWITDHTDYPPEKLVFLLSAPTWRRKKAAEFGPYAEVRITVILEESAMRNLRKARAILRLAEKHSAYAEKVSERVLNYGNTRCKAIKAMLENNIVPTAEPHRVPLSDLGQRFLRMPSYFGWEVSHD